MEDHQVKVMLVGSSGVGKTSLISAYFDNPFEKDLTTTVAPASCTSMVNLPNNITVSMHIWDTAGQEQFQSISLMFYRESNVALVCWDWRQDGQLDMWISQVKSEAPECAIFLVVTKADLLTKEELEKIEQSRSELLQKHEAKHLFITSSLENRNIKEVFDKAATYYQNDKSMETMNLALTPEPQKRSSTCC